MMERFVWEIGLLRCFSTRRALALSTVLLALVACSKPDEQAEAVDVASVRILFAEGFRGDTSDERTRSRSQSQSSGDSQDARAGIPFDRSSRVTRQVQEAMAQDIDKLLSVRFALADPGEFVRSGKAKTVAERELAARGYSADTLAGTTALMFGVGWELSNGRKLSAADNAAILRQMNTRLRSDPLQRQTDEQRQVQADLRLLLAGLWLEEAYVRETFPDQKRELSDAVHRDMTTMTANDMRAVTVTADGFSD